ncbi:carboxypeptidase-like regulatory domain-containing protein [uncultured Psychroserpens sp.]|uniref:carboxypeptidase-like regulatory domain-containing protein n=1 Tax=uncultured Psychroserpens sp. TaxID=255436 RepID=UPI00260B8DC7|nr:carboxypeptidase-like regulatory domain-containing protein [uncultured Psychroserpens sp.]
MKTLTMKRIAQTLGVISIVMIAAVISNPLYAQTQVTASATAVGQQMTIKGKVSDDKGPLPGVNIVLKGSKVGAITDGKGEFTFPKALSSGDILVFSFLGYEKQEVKIDSNTTFINLVLSTDLVEIMGAVSTDKPYKSKRSKN